MRINYIIIFKNINENVIFSTQIIENSEVYFFVLEPFELARHSSTSNNDCIDQGPGNRPTFESELEEYEEDIIEHREKKISKGSKSDPEESTSGLTEDNENDRKRYSSSIHQKGRFGRYWEVLGYISFILGYLKNSFVHFLFRN